MSSKSITLEVRDDNSTEDADRVVSWARKFDGVEAHVVFDYVALGAGGELMPGAVSGVTVQWDHVDRALVAPVLGDAVVEFVDRDGDEQVAAVQYVEVPAVNAPTAEKAVHVRPGQKITRVEQGFEVTA